MHERQEEEPTQLLRDVLIVAALERAVRDLARKRIGRVGARIAAEDVTRKLIEHDAERERAFGSGLPRFELARRGRLIGRQKFLAYTGVERVVAREPSVVASLPPEREDGFGGGDLVG